MISKHVATAVAVMLMTVAKAGTCPITECNYADPAYQAAVAETFKCTQPIEDAFTRAMDQLAIIYPRFGVAWHSYYADLKAFAADPNGKNTEFEAAHRRFEDRILSTAESDALQIYDLWTIKMKAGLERCGPVPEPPLK